jgi:hypothetical protein
LFKKLWNCSKSTVFGSAAQRKLQKFSNLPQNQLKFNFELLLLANCKKFRCAAELNSAFVRNSKTFSARLNKIHYLVAISKNFSAR